MAFPTIVQAITGLRLKKKTLMLPRSQVSSAEICDDAGSCCSGSTPMGSGSGSGPDACTTECFIYGCDDLVCPPINLCCTIENISATSCGALDGVTFPVTLNFAESGSPCYIALGTHTYADCEISGVLNQVDPSIAGIYYPYLVSSVPTSFWSFDGEYICGVGRKNFALNNGTTWVESLQCNPFKLVLQLADSSFFVSTNAEGAKILLGTNQIRLTIEACAGDETPPVETECCPGELPGTLYLNLTNGCESFGADSPLVYDADGEDGPGWYSETKVVMGDTIYFRFWCAGSTMFEIQAYKNGDANGLGIAEPDSCDPFDWTATITHSGYACDGNLTLTATINE